MLQIGTSQQVQTKEYCEAQSNGEIIHVRTPVRQLQPVQTYGRLQQRQEHKGIYCIDSRTSTSATDDARPLISAYPMLR